MSLLTIQFFGGVFKLGFTGVYLNRKELVDQVSKNTEIDLESDDYNSGWLNYVIAGAKVNSSHCLASYTRRDSA